MFGDSWPPSRQKNKTGNPKKGQYSVFVFKVLGISVQGMVAGRPKSVEIQKNATHAADTKVKFYITKRTSNNKWACVF